MSERTATRMPTVLRYLVHRDPAEPVKISGRQNLQQTVIGASYILDVAGSTSRPTFRRIPRRSPFQDAISLTVDGVNVRGFLRSAFARVTGENVTAGIAPPESAEGTSASTDNTGAQLALFAL